MADQPAEAKTIWIVTEQIGWEEQAPQHALGAFTSPEAAREAIRQELGFESGPEGWWSEPWDTQRVGEACSVLWLYRSEVVPLVFRLVPFTLDQPCMDVGLTFYPVEAAGTWH